MKKTMIVSIASLIFLTLCSLVGWLFRFAPSKDAVLFVVLGLVICAVSGFFLFLFKKHAVMYWIAYFLNAFALGLCIRGWYIFRNYDNPLWLMLLISFIATLYLWVFYLFLRIPFFNQHYIAFTILYMLISIICYVLVIVLTKTTYVSTYGWYMMIEIAFVFALSIEAEDRLEIFQHTVLSTYSVLVVAILMLIIMLAGDSADFSFDGSIFDSFSSSKKKKRTKRIK